MGCDHGTNTRDPANSAGRYLRDILVYLVIRFLCGYDGITLFVSSVRYVDSQQRERERERERERGRRSKEINLPLYVLVVLITTSLMINKTIK